jgi:hypothetical protein
MLDWFNNFVSIHEIDEDGAHLQIIQKIMSDEEKAFEYQIVTAAWWNTHVNKLLYIYIYIYKGSKSP